MSLITVEDLKAQWKADPCWDIEETEGFEDLRNELLIWRLEYERNQYRDRLHELLDALRVINRCAIEAHRFLL